MKRILWISDIHLNGSNYNGKPKLLVASFIKYLTENFSPSDISSMVISGDIAFSGSDEKHYKCFADEIIKPLKKHFNNLNILSVPGNHDLDWNAFQEKFIAKLVHGMTIESFMKSINRDYFQHVFLHYNKFHEKNIGEYGNTFSHLNDSEDNILFICLNSAWLSVGKPFNNLEIVEEKKVNQILFYEITDKNDKSKVLFQELGNQTYGFSLPDIKKDLNAIKQDIKDKYKNRLKVLVVHHPPNNWLRWDELYSESPTDKTDFHNFIIDLNIDIILAGHEHVSLVEGGLVYGKALILHGGMFLDHNEESKSPSWFKILEIETGQPNAPKVSERWFLHSNTDAGIWEERQNSSVCYQGWNNICKKLAPNGNSTKQIKAEGLSNDLKERLTLNDAALRQLIASSNLEDAKNEILEITGFDESKTDVTLTKEGLLAYLDQVESQVRRLFIINNLDDFFVDYEGEVPESTYLRALLRAVVSPEEEIFIFYTATILPKVPDYQRDEIRNLIQFKFEQFRFKIFNVAVCVQKLRNSKLAIRL